MASLSKAYIVLLKQESLTLMTEQAQALSSCQKEFLSGFQWNGKSLCYQLLPYVMDYQLGRTNAALVNTME